MQVSAQRSPRSYRCLQRSHVLLVCLIQDIKQIRGISCQCGCCRTCLTAACFLTVAKLVCDCQSRLCVLRGMPPPSWDEQQLPFPLDALGQHLLVFVRCICFRVIQPQLHVFRLGLPSVFLKVAWWCKIPMLFSKQQVVVGCNAV